MPNTLAPTPSVAVYFLGGKRLPGATTHIEGLIDVVPGILELKRAFSARELLAYVKIAPKAVVVLCMSDKQELIEVMGLLKSLEAKPRIKSIRVLVFSSFEMARIDTLLLSSGCVDVLPYSLSRRGLLTKIHFSVSILENSLGTAQNDAGASRWVIHAETGDESPKYYPVHEAEFAIDWSESPTKLFSEFATGEAAFTTLKLQVLVYPGLDPASRPVEAKVLECDEGSFVLDLPVESEATPGTGLLVELICEGELNNRCRVELLVDSVEQTGDGRKLLFGTLVKGETKSLQATVAFLGDRQNQIDRFLEAARGF